MSTLNAVTLKSTTIQHTNGTNALTIDSSGRVTRAQNISFKAYSTVGDVTFTSTQSTVIWSTTQHNLGSCYSNSTGRFTAPVSGTYHFGAHFYRQVTGDFSRIWIYTNSSNPAYSILPTSNANTIQAHCTTYMNANDYAYVQAAIQATGQYYFADNHSFFYGFLIG